MKYAYGKIIAEGKTKRIRGVEGMPTEVIVESKNDLTAGDGEKHDVVNGKAIFSNETTSNVFKLLKACGLPVAFIEKVDQTRFLAEKCSMIPYEVVVRREAHGSYLKRHPELHGGHLFPRLILEFFLKTSSRQWHGIDIPKNDPLVLFEEHSASLYLPDRPIYKQSPFMILDEFPLKDLRKDMERLNQVALKTFLALEKSWQLLGRRLVDLKLEFGRDATGAVKLADVIDNDSWRLLDRGAHMDKQLYRYGFNLNVVMSSYRLVAELTKNFGLPRQQIVIWRASEKDDIKPLKEAINIYGAYNTCDIKIVTRSVHKEPARAYEEIVNFVHEVPDSVIIACVGRSNGAGPILSAQVSVPVITVPTRWNDFPEDVWSSLRAPGDTPVMTVLDPQNAVLSALQILAARNPRLYAELRIRQERRLLNIVKL